jgi:hypothetical protein
MLWIPGIEISRIQVICTAKVFLLSFTAGLVYDALQFKSFLSAWPESYDQNTNNYAAIWKESKEQHSARSDHKHVIVNKNRSPNVKKTTEDSGVWILYPSCDKFGATSLLMMCFVGVTWGTYRKTARAWKIEGRWSYRLRTKDRIRYTDKWSRERERVIFEKFRLLFYLSDENSDSWKETWNTYNLALQARNDVK